MSWISWLRLTDHRRNSPSPANLCTTSSEAVQNIENLSEEDKNDTSSNNLLVLISAGCNDSILQTTENEVLSTSDSLYCW